MIVNYKIVLLFHFYIKLFFKEFIAAYIHVFIRDYSHRRSVIFSTTRMAELHSQLFVLKRKRKGEDQAERADNCSLYYCTSFPVYVFFSYSPQQSHSSIYLFSSLFLSHILNMHELSRIQYMRKPILKTKSARLDK